MKKIFFTLLFFAFLVPTFANVQNTEKPKVVVSFSILEDFVRQIAGDAVEVESLVGPDGDAHIYEPTPSDAKKIIDAQLIIINGLGFEGWISRLLESTGTKAKLIVASKKVIPLYVGEEKNSIPDPHAWHNIENAILYAEVIVEALTELIPEKRKKLLKNWKVFRNKLQKMDIDFKNQIKNISPKCRKVITLHDGFHYLGEAYGIEFLTPLGISTEAEPSAKDLVSIIKQAKKQGIQVVFLENISNPRVMEQIAKESGAKIGDVLFSDALSEKNGVAGTFEKMVHHNFSVFLKAFSKSCKSEEIVILNNL